MTYSEEIKNFIEDTVTKDRKSNVKGYTHKKRENGLQTKSLNGLQRNKKQKFIGLNREKFQIVQMTQNMWNQLSKNEKENDCLLVYTILYSIDDSNEIALGFSLYLDTPSTPILTLTTTPHPSDLTIHPNINNGEHRHSVSKSGRD